MLLSEWKDSVEAGVTGVVDPIGRSKIKCVVLLDEIDTRDKTNKKEDLAAGQNICSLISKHDLKTMALIGTTNHEELLIAALKDRMTKNGEFRLPNRQERRRALEQYFSNIRAFRSRARIAADCLAGEYIDLLAGRTNYFSYRRLWQLVDNALRKACCHGAINSTAAMLDAYGKGTLQAALHQDIVEVTCVQVNAALKEECAKLSAERLKELKKNIWQTTKKVVFKYGIPVVSAATPVVIAILQRRDAAHQRSFRGQFQNWINSPLTYAGALTMVVTGLFTVSTGGFGPIIAGVLIFVTAGGAQIAQIPGAKAALVPVIKEIQANWKTIVFVALDSLSLVGLRISKIGMLS